MKSSFAAVALLAATWLAAGTAADAAPCHSTRSSQGRFAGYRMGRDQSAGIGALANAREMKGQQTGARSCTADKARAASVTT
jgi:hypothetical protein